MTEYPRMLFRDGDEIDVNGIMVDTMIVNDLDGLREALRNGWRIGLTQHPLDHDGDGNLGGSRPRRGRPPLNRA